MRRERRVIINKMYELEIMEDIDRQLGCGYAESDFGMHVYRDTYAELFEQLANTYGMTGEEYFALEQEWGYRLMKIQGIF